MAVRFRKSMKVMPGVRLNLSGSGPSVSVGVRGARATYSARGTRTTVGIPGTGLSASSYRSYANDTRRKEREARTEARAATLSKVRVEVDQEGRVSIFGASGSPLKGRDLSDAWKLHGDTIQQRLESHAAEINEAGEALAGVHLDTPPPHVRLLAPPPFSEAEPVPPIPPQQPRMPELVEPPRPGKISSIFGGRRRYERALDLARAEHEKRMADHRTELARLEERHRFAREEWSAKCDRHAAEKAAHEMRAEAEFNALSVDAEAASSGLEAVFGAMEWPRETLVSFDVAPGCRLVQVDVDLPEIEDMPQEDAKLAGNGKRLLIKAKSQKALRLEYARHIHGICLRIAGTVFAALPGAKRVLVSGYSQRVDPATGADNDDYLVSVEFTREGLARLDYDNLGRLDPVKAVAAFEHRRGMTQTGVFKPIEPLTAESTATA